jgi:predicted enzyme related to lactoylglutathione lyase
MLVACASPGPGGGTFDLTDTPLHGKFVWNDLITDDPQAARAFYGGLFDWTFVDTQRPSGGNYTLIVAPSGRYVGGIVRQADPGDGVDYSRWLAYLAVPDIDESVDYANDSGGRIVVPARDIGKLARVAVIIDAQGAVVGLIHSNRGYPMDIDAAAGEVAAHELLAADGRAAAEWYTPVAGFTVRDEQRPGGTYHWLVASGTPRAGIMQRPDDRVQPTWLTHFRVDDLAASVAKVQALGGQVLLAPSADVRGGSLAVAADPTGALLALSGPAN